jgi:hypothetical protein
MKNSGGWCEGLVAMEGFSPRRREGRQGFFEFWRAGCGSGRVLVQAEDLVDTPKADYWVLM